MERSFYLDLAASGLRIPIGTDLVFNEEDDPEAVLRDGRRLGQVVERAAKRYSSPLAIPLMDLRLEKADLLRNIGVEEAEIDSFHFEEAPSEAVIAFDKACMMEGESPGILRKLALARFQAGDRDGGEPATR